MDQLTLLIVYDSIGMLYILFMCQSDPVRPLRSRDRDISFQRVKMTQLISFLIIFDFVLICIMQV